jgi:hypothetical protein
MSKIQISQTLLYFVTKLRNFTKFIMLFPTAPMKFLNSKIRLKWEGRSISDLPDWDPKRNLHFVLFRAIVDLPATFRERP